MKTSLSYRKSTSNSSKKKSDLSEVRPVNFIGRDYIKSLDKLKKLFSLRSKKINSKSSQKNKNGKQTSVKYNQNCKEKSIEEKKEVVSKFNNLEQNDGNEESRNSSTINEMKTLY